MARKVLGLIEDNIGTKLLLATRLKELGYQTTILSAPVAFRERVEADSFDWIILDDAALPPVRRRFLDHLGRHRKEARIVWCGKSPRWTSVPLEATFEKPLRYDEIERFFSHWTSDVDGARNAREEVPWKPVGKPKGPPHRAEAAQKTPAETGGTDETAGTEGEKQQ
jgi:hypothetical protein